MTQLHSSDLGRSNVVESFDVVSLYTNVQNEQALQALSEMHDRHANNINTFGLSKMHIMTLVKEYLSCNIFKWAGEYFSQVRGLAMGQRLAPVLAVCFMGRIEEPFLERHTLMYCSTLNLLEKYHVTDGSLISTPKSKCSSGVVSVKWYRKTSSRNILLHATSAHPQAVKRAVVNNMLRTATSVCTGEAERHESRRLASEIAAANGYTVSQVCGKCHISRKTEISARKALEAFWIFQRNPKMNGRDECASITNDLLPYIPHCEL
uniref:Reverse transcriptase domain-containing protein n=2 Tax=Haemonchus contortus TaxID=6289 RepID=A0A7I4YFE8_HAECO